jgi:nucleoside phosphorylase
MAFEPPKSRRDFEIGILCALPLELDAAVAALDQVWDDDIRLALGQAEGDDNTYVCGRIGPHNVVLTSLRIRAGQPTMGKANAAIVASDLAHSYRGLRLVLLVGICGGVPMDGDKEILLGDVVISSSVVQYDFGRQYPHGFERKEGPQNSLAAPVKGNASILSHLAMKFGKDGLRNRTIGFLKSLQQHHPEYAFPDPATDRLFQSHYRHKHQTPQEPACKCQDHKEEADPVCKKAMESACDKLGCDDGYLVQRSRLSERLAAAASGAEPDAAVFQPDIHVGKVATGDTVMKSGVGRDTIAQKEKVIAFEMEAAGIWEQLPCLVVKGVCDYADSHKNKDWQKYAAATAAAAAKGIAMLHTPADKSERSETRSLQFESILDFRPDPAFVGRPDISEWLTKMSRQPAERVALVGLGGIGKSQLAIQFAHGVRNRSHVFWVNATTWNTLEASYRRIAERVGLNKPGQATSMDDMLGRVGDWLSQAKNGRWTVILDNFDDASILPANDLHLTRLLPHASHGFVLITSRTATAAAKLTGSSPGKIFQVPPMGEKEALDLLRAKIANGDALVEEEAAELVRLLDYMPLAISQAAAYINRPATRTSVRDYADKLRNQDKRKTLLKAGYEELGRYGGASNAILTTWTVTLDQIKRERPTAADLLCLMSFFSPQSIPERVLRTGYAYDAEALPPAKVRDTMSSGMTTLLSNAPFFSTRRYLYKNLDVNVNSRVWAEWVESDPVVEKQHEAEQEKKSSKGRWKSRLSSRAKGLFSSSSSSSSTVTGSEERFTLLGHTQAQDDTGSVGDGTGAGPDDRLAADLETLLGYCLVTPSTMKGVLKMHPLVRTCTETWLAQTGRMAQWKKRFVLVMVSNTGASKTVDRLMAPGAKISLHIEPLVQEEPRPDDAQSVLVWVLLGLNIYYEWSNNGSSEAADKLLDRMIALAEKGLGPGHRLTLRCLDLRATQLHYEREYDKAAAVCEDLFERAVWVDDYCHHIVYESRLHYAAILRDQGRFAEAEDVARGIVEQRRLADGEKHEETLLAMANHVTAMVRVGKLQEAGDVAVQLIREDWTGRDEHTYMLVMNLLGGALLGAVQTGEGDEVGKLVRRAVEAVEAVPDTYRWFAYTGFGPFHFALWAWLLKQGKDAEAQAAKDRGIEHMANVFALPRLEPPELAEDYLAAGEDDEETRQRLLRQVIKNLEIDDGRSMEVFYWEMANIARRLYIQGRDGEGATLLDAMTRRIKAAYGENHTMAKSPGNLKHELELWRDSIVKKGSHADSEKKEESVSVDPGP